MQLKPLIKQVLQREHLSEQQAYEAFHEVMTGNVDAATLGALLCGLASKGEQASELVGAARAMREAAVKVSCAVPCLDTCGTGGDGISTFNVSTTAALIAAAAGAVVAKHGNRTNTRASGSAEVLQSLGVNIDADKATMEECLREAGIAFLYAVKLHPAMKYAAPVRKVLQIRTIFNLLGPLCNPAGASRQVLGVSQEAHIELIANALLALGTERAWVVHGSDGLCDLTISGPTHVADVCDGRIERFTIEPGDAGLPSSALSELLVTTPEESARAVRGVLAGEPGPKRDHALLNAAAAMVVFGACDTLREGAEMAAKAIDEGKAADKLKLLAELSHQSMS